MNEEIRNNSKIIYVNPEDLKEVKSTDSDQPDQSTELTPSNILDLDKILDEEEKEEKKENLFIKTATPYKMIFTKKDNGNEVAIMMYLCVDNNDKAFMINRNIPVVSEDHKDRLCLLPFTEEDTDAEFVNVKICNNILLGKIDNYVTNMKFSVDDDFKSSENPILHVDLTNVKSRDTITADISASTFSALAFIDNYMREDTINEHDLSLATITASKENNSIAKFFVVDSIDKVVAMAPAEVTVKNKFRLKDIFKFFKKKESHDDSIAIVIKLSRDLKAYGKEAEVVNLLTPFTVGEVLEESKFKGNTIKEFEQNYYGDSDQYVSTLTINNITLGGIDKSYMLIRAKTKTGNTNLFLLDYSIQKELKDKINEY